MLEVFDEVRLAAPRTPERWKDGQRRHVEQDQYLRMHALTQSQLNANTTGEVCVALSPMDTFAWLQKIVRLNRRFADGRQCANWDFGLASVHIVGTTFHQFARMWVHPEHGRPNSTSDMRRKENQPPPLLSLESSTLSNVWNDTGREVWNCGFHLNTGQNRRCRRKSTEARLSTLGCRAAAMNPQEVRHIAISVGALVISVSAQLLHGGHQILFDAVQWPWFPGIMMHVRVVQHVRQPSIGGVLLGRNRGRSRSWRRRTIRTWKGSTRNWRGTSCIWSALAVRRSDWSWCGIASWRSSSRTSRTSWKDSIQPFFVVEANPTQSWGSWQRRPESTEVKIDDAAQGFDLTCQLNYADHSHNSRDVDVRLHRALEKIRCAQ